MSESDTPIDVDRLRSIFGDDETLVEMYALFAEDVRTRLTGLEEAVRAGDWDAYRRIGHTLKGSSGNMGATRLSGIGLACESVDSQDEGVSGLETASAEIARVCAFVEEFVSAHA